ncbi:MAG: MmgE/PrpD family protein [Sciscionella sp.]
MTGSDNVDEFVRELNVGDVPGEIVRQARLCLLDTIGVAFAGSRTPMSHMMRDHVVEHYASAARGARLLADGRRASLIGVALAGAATVDSMDGHDGHDLTKGHAGAAVIPALLAFADTQAEPTSGAELLTRLIIGYEIGIRAGIALHTTAADYHASGAWNALAAAAVGARTLKLDPAGTRHALGIAEFHGPRSPMMRCIDHPTMVKDGSAAGAGVGVEAALLAARGFTGAPAATLQAAGTEEIWADLGTRWRIAEQYRKPYPVCRWAHPAIQAALTLATEHHQRPEDVDTVEVTTFHQATRLATIHPATTEQAQYSLPFTIAVALTHREIHPDHLSGASLTDARILRLADRTTLREDAELTRAFPARRVARLRIGLRDGQILTSPDTTARGGPDEPRTESELHATFTRYTEPVIGTEDSAAVAYLVDTVGNLASVHHLLDTLHRPTTRTC